MNMETQVALNDIQLRQLESKIRAGLHNDEDLKAYHGEYARREKIEQEEIERQAKIKREDFQRRNAEYAKAHPPLPTTDEAGAIENNNKWERLVGSDKFILLQRPRGVEKWVSEFAVQPVPTGPLRTFTTHKQAVLNLKDAMRFMEMN